MQLSSWMGQVSKSSYFVSANDVLITTITKLIPQVVFQYGFHISRRSVKPFRRYGRFSIFKMAAVLHLGFSKVGIFNCPYPSEGQNASSCQITRRSIKPFRRYGRFSIFKDSGRPPSWICFTLVGPPMKSIWWSLWLCKIWLLSAQ